MGDDQSTYQAKGFADLARWSLLACLRRGYHDAPSKRMTIVPRGSISYADAFVQTCTLVNYFKSACGIGPGKVVALSSPNLMRTALVIAAVEACGARLALLPSALARPDFAHYTSLVDPNLIIVATAEHCAMARELFPDVQLMAIGCRDVPVPCVDDVARGFEYGADALNVSCLADKAKYIVFSSGSTGLPKAIVNRSLSFAYNGICLRRALGFIDSDAAFVPVPIAHVFGIVGLYAVLGGGGTLVTMEKFTPEDACVLIETTRATLHLGVPTMYLRELRVNRGGLYNLSSLRTGVVAGSSCPDKVILEYERRYGCRLMPSYGMSETAATLTVCDIGLPAEVRAVTVGVAIEGASIKVDPESGEVLCKSPSMMEGIIKPDGTFDPGVDEDGWLHSGDVGESASDGSLRIIGRIKDIIIRGGINIFPAEIERTYQEHPDVSECCLLGYEDSELGERTALAVILRDGAAVSSIELRSWSKGRVEKVKIPDIVLKMDDFPRLSSGKVDKKALKRRVDETLANLGVAGSNQTSVGRR